MCCQRESRRFQSLSNDEDIEYFDVTLEKPKVVRAGFWKTRRGEALIQKAEFIAKSYKGKTIHKYGMVQSKLLFFDPDPHIAFVSQDQSSQSNTDEDSNQSANDRLS